jgi:hypothetical protein
MWLATVTGPNRHRSGTTGAKIRGDETRPGTSRIGIVFSMPGGFRIRRIWREIGGIREPELKSAAGPVK